MRYTTRRVEIGPWHVAQLGGWVSVRHDLGTLDVFVTVHEYGTGEERTVPVGILDADTVEVRLPVGRWFVTVVG